MNAAIEGEWLPGHSRPERSNGIPAAELEIWMAERTNVAIDSIPSPPGHATVVSTSPELIAGG
ncbi:MAG TPA: hypothetical protein VH061_11085 [Solirubrobacteraceae bacterium]|nr:hypothetical protein [Solirubrobacteraceae bacterium]